MLPCCLSKATVLRTRSTCHRETTKAGSRRLIIVGWISGQSFEASAIRTNAKKIRRPRAI
jgi:hypothetical protein